jgi:hypothetical protein
VSFDVMPLDPGTVSSLERSYELAAEVDLPDVAVNIRWDHADVMLPALIEIVNWHEIVFVRPASGRVSPAGAA